MSSESTTLKFWSAFPGAQKRYSKDASAALPGLGSDYVKLAENLNFNDGDKAIKKYIKNINIDFKIKFLLIIKGIKRKNIRILK